MEARHGDVDGVAWDLIGDGPGVPVLALHGVTDSGACWHPVARHWATDRAVLTVDARGHGRSGLPRDEAFTIAALADDVARVLDAVLGGRPVVAVGHSMGGLVAEELALAEPDLVTALVLEDPAWSRDGELDEHGVPSWLRSFVRSFAGGSRGALEARSYEESPRWPDDEHSPWAASKRQLDQGFVDVPHDWRARDWVDAVAGLAMPVTLVTGDPALGALVTPEQAARAAALLGDRFTHVPIAGAGHNVRRDRRAEFLAAVAPVLAAADAGRR